MASFYLSVQMLDDRKEKLEVVVCGDSFAWRHAADNVKLARKMREVRSRAQSYDCLLGVS